MISVFSNTFCQNILRYDTINIISVKKVDTSNDKIYESAKVFFINGSYYHGNNFPFLSLKAKCNEKKNDKLFYLDYLPAINSKSINTLNKVLKKGIFYRITPYDIPFNNEKLLLSNETKFLLDCIQTENKSTYLISEQKIIAAFLIVNCGVELGVHDVIFCTYKVVTSQTPVLLNVADFIKN